MINGSLFSCRIVQAFENIVDTLIGQNNFTNISIVARDVALIAETVSSCKTKTMM